MTTESTSASYDERYEKGIERYESGEAIETLIPHFQQLRGEKFDVRVAVALSWLYTLAGQKERALHYCKEAKGVPQGKYNHALALLTFNEKGVREKLDEAYQMGGQEGLNDAIENLNDAIKRKGGVYPAADKMLKWLKEMA
jgi:hypothetical protein